jgi:hypothetical protein
LVQEEETGAVVFPVAVVDVAGDRRKAALRQAEIERF